MRNRANHIAFLLITSMFFNTLSMPLMYLDFQANRSYIASALCVNRDKPITVCGGQCYFNKQFREHRQEQQSGKTASLKKTHFENFYKSIRVRIPANGFFLDQNEDTPYLNTYDLLFPSEIFHPPIA